LGGALCSVLAARYLNWQPDRQVQLQTFGMPKPGDIRLHNLLKPTLSVHVQNEGDCIPIAPPSITEMGPLISYPGVVIALKWSEYHYPAGLWTLDAQGNLTEGGPATSFHELLLPCVQAWALGLPQPAGLAHPIAEYLRRLSEQP